MKTIHTQVIDCNMWDTRFRIDMCAYGHQFKKPTVFFSSTPLPQFEAKCCQGLGRCQAMNYRGEHFDFDEAKLAARHMYPTGVTTPFGRAVAMYLIENVPKSRSEWVQKKHPVSKKRRN
jgi:hypothetical protein